MKYTQITSDKSRKKALILCAAGGIIGLHDFYLGKIGTGILKVMMVNWFFIGWMVDLIKISTGGYRDNAKAYLRQW